MAFSGMNYWAIVLATIAGYVFGALYYTALSKPWMAAAGLDQAKIAGATGKTSPLPFVIAFFAQGLMAFVLAGTIGHLGPGQVTLANGVISGVFVWAGFVLTTLMVNHRFQMQPWSLTLIDGGHWLGVLIIMGAVIGWMGV